MAPNGVVLTEKKVQRLRCSVKNYDWGRIGIDSLVGKLYSANSRVEIDPKKPYAEIWMGTHESGPSYVIRKDEIFGNGKCIDSNGKAVNLNGKCGDSNGKVVNLNGNCCDSNGKRRDMNGFRDSKMTLKSWIEKNPNVLGDMVRMKWGCDLPFLFKVLSVAKPLSIQAHPCKELARILHKSQPDVYKDENHKPEMALAVTDFEAIYGFVDMKELQSILDCVPEIEKLVGKEVVASVKNITDEDEEYYVREALKLLFSEIMSARKEVVAGVLSELKIRLNAKDKRTSKEELALELEKQYPGDVGVIASFLMNYVKLKPGQALCVGYNELHAYISGDCIECMATSDNVVRAGLTPKKRDVPALCKMLTYKQGPPEILKGVNINDCTKRYQPRFEEFEVDHCILSEGSSTKFPSVAAPSLFLITRGTGTFKTGFSVEDIGMGDVLFIPANTEIIVVSESGNDKGSESGLELYRAGVNGQFF